MKIGSVKIKTKTILVGGMLLSMAFIIISIIQNGLQDRYAQDILNYRKQKNDYFKTSDKSPIEFQENFTELRYFDPNKEYLLKPTAELITDSSFVVITNNDGEKNKYWRYAKAFLVFEDGGLDTVTILRKDKLAKEDQMYFLPFYDETNGDETYMGGRYLDLTITNLSELKIDFNLAYNPYCVYNYRFSCPIPPSENRLNRRVEAGERMFLK